ncbi:MAG: YeeE/YedE family protein [Dichotomicrobium sp.]
MNRIAAGIAAAGLLAVALVAAQEGGARLALAVLIGGFAGIALYHAAFGFTGAWRRLIQERRGAGLRAQMLLIGVTAAVSFPLIGYGASIGLPTGGFVFPFGVAAAFGAFLFGIGMQLGGGCGSGTLYTAGGGSTRMTLTLAAFIAGSVLGVAHLPAWQGLPRLEPVSFIGAFGAWPALALTAAVLAALAFMSAMLERARHGAVEDWRATESLIRGPWSLLAGALALAAVGIATFLVLGRPWGITSAFALWGSKIAGAAGVPIETWSYWQWQPGALERSVFADPTSVMDFGIILGAMAAAALAGRFAPVWRLSARDVATAILGGLLMGYGARLAYGCNIGGFLGGVVSGSLHGWGWLVFGLLGNALGAWLRGPGARPAPKTVSERGEISA